MTITAKEISVIPSSDGIRRSIDPNGKFGGFSVLSNAVTPSISLISQPDQIVQRGTIYQAVFESTEAGSWSIAGECDDFILTTSPDSKIATITWNIPAGLVPESFFCGVRIRNNSGVSKVLWDRVHVRGTRVPTLLFVGTNKQYTNLTDAFSAMDFGDRIIIDDGEYISLDMQVWSNAVDNEQQPKAGTYTTDNSGIDPVYTPTEYSTIMARSPFGYIFNGQGVNEGVLIWGNTDLEDYERNTLGWNNGGSAIAPNTERRAIALKGLVGKNTSADAFSVFHCDHVKSIYCAGIDGGRFNPTTNNNVTSVIASRSTDILFENCAGFGEGRYKITGYETKRMIYRRCMMRHDHRNGTEPVGGAIFYRGRDSRCQNTYHFDSDTSEFWRTANLNQGSFGTPATGANSYPTNVQFQRCGTYNSHMGFTQNDGYDQSPSDSTMALQDCFGYGIKNVIGSLAFDGPIYATRFTLDKVEGTSNLGATEDSSDFLFNFRNYQQYDDSIFTQIGWNPGLADTENQGPLIFCYFSNITVINDSYLWNFKGRDSAVGDQSDTAELNNINRTDNPTNIGYKYLGRVEQGSILSDNAKGCDKAFLSKGKSGTLMFEADHELESDIDVFPRMGWENLAPLLRDYSYTGELRSGGTGTLSGDRGAAQTTTNLMDYILSAKGNTPYLYSVNAEKKAGQIDVTFDQFQSGIQSGITGYKLKINDEIVQTIASNAHGVRLNDLILGYSYKISLIATHSTTGDSGDSNPIQMVF